MICSQRRALAFGKSPGNTLSVTMVCWDISESSCSEGDAGIPAKLLWDRNSCKRHHSNTLLVSVCCTLLGAERELCPVCSFSYLCMKCEGEGKRERQEKSVFLCQTKGEFPSGPRRVQEGLVLNSLSRNCRLCSLLQWTNFSTNFSPLEVPSFNSSKNKWGKIVPYLGSIND